MTDSTRYPGTGMPRESTAPLPPQETTSTTDTAKEQASTVGHDAKQAGAHVADTAKEEARHVASEAKSQARQLWQQTQSEAEGQAGQQQDRLARGLRSLGDELEQMAKGTDQSGLATDLARQGSAKAREVAGWLENRQPDELLSEVRQFARRRPGTFLAIAAGAGLLGGRLTRGLASEHQHAGQQTASSPAPIDHTTGGYSAYGSATEEPRYTSAGSAPVSGAGMAGAPVAGSEAGYGAADPMANPAATDPLTGGTRTGAGGDSGVDRGGYTDRAEPPGTERGTGERYT